MSASNNPSPLASVQHRLGGKALDFAISIVTFNIGWLIWSLVVWGRGQTPGKQILKMRVYDKTTGKPAKWGHMAFREFGLPLAVILTVLILNQAFRYVFSIINITELIGRGLLLLNATLSLALLSVVLLVDPLWIFRKGRRNRLTDVVLKTDVLNESAKIGSQE